MAVVNRIARAMRAGERRMARESMDIDPNLAEELAALKKKEKSSELTAREERRLDQLMNQRIRESGAEKPEGMSRIMKERGLTEKEKKELQESLEYKKGGMVKKPAKKKMYNKGGMANCGASMKPAQKAKK
jgi:succinate dehydrogenase/fumarate reductase flavoprotein subunit